MKNIAYWKLRTTEFKMIKTEKIRTEINKVEIKVDKTKPGVESEKFVKYWNFEKLPI